MATNRYAVTPQPKVRMTRRDTWATDKVRPSVQKWRAFVQDVKRLGITVQDGDSITYVIPMPASWSRKKRAAMEGLLHRQKPDIDNIEGGLLDAALPDGDEAIAELGAKRKVWGVVGEIIIERRDSSAQA